MLQKKIQETFIHKLLFSSSYKSNAKPNIGYVSFIRKIFQVVDRVIVKCLTIRKNVKSP